MLSVQRFLRTPGEPPAVEWITHVSKQCQAVLFWEHVNKLSEAEQSWLMLNNFMFLQLMENI